MQYTDSLVYPYFNEFERLARNRPHPNIDPAYPKTTDGTAASLVRKAPRRVIQQIPTGKIHSEQSDWLSIIADFIYREKILAYADTQYSLIQKCWGVVEKALTFGSCFTYAPFVMHDDGYFCPDLVIPYWGDVFIQPGKVSLDDCNYFFLRSWWRPEDIKALIDKETQLQAQAKKRKETYESTWDLGALRAVQDYVSTKDQKARTPSEKEKSVSNPGGVELITAFQKGLGAKFYTFHYPSQEIVRTKENKDPRGKLPVQAMYGDIDGYNPFGRGIMELIGGMQNLLDSEVQMYQYNRAYNLNPALIKKGEFNKNELKFQPNAIIDLGSNPNNSVEPLTIDSVSLTSFPNNYQLMKSEMLALVAAPDTTIPGSAGNPSNSKTPQGVQLTQSTLSIDDNYIRKQFEAWFKEWSETAINLYFAEKSGVEELQLDQETAGKLRNLPNFDTSLISEDNKIQINYDDETEILSFRINPSSSNVTDDAEQFQAATTLIDLVEKYPMLNKRFGGRIDAEELAARAVLNSAINDPEQIAPPLTEQEKEQKQAMQGQIDPFAPLFDKPHIAINYGDVEDPASRAQLLKLAGAPPAGQLLPMSPAVAIEAARSLGQLVPEESGGPSSDKQPNVDLGDIYKNTDDPNVKAEIEQAAGLNPDPVHTFATHAANTAENLRKAADSIKPPEQNAPNAKAPKESAEPPAEEAVESPQQEAQEQLNPIKNPADAAIVQKLTEMGVAPEKIGQALALLHTGHSIQDILKVIRS